MSEVAVAAKDVISACSERAAKNPSGRSIFGKLLHRKVSKTETPTTKMSMHNPFSVAKHLRDWIHRKTSSFHIDGQKQARSLSDTVFEKIFEEPYSLKAAIIKDKLIGQVEPSIATAGAGNCNEIFQTAEKSRFLGRSLTNNEFDVIATRELVTARAPVCDGAVVDATATCNPDCPNCFSMPDIVNRTMSFSDPYDNITIVPIDVDIDKTSTVEKFQKTVTSISEELEHDSFSTIDLGEYRPSELAVGPPGFEIWRQENSMVPLHFTPMNPSTRVSVITNTVCNVLGSIGERASKVVRQQLATKRQQKDTINKDQIAAGHEPYITSAQTSPVDSLSPAFAFPNTLISKLQ
ncbi:hypothetical protein V1509DRAFT_567686 [Lipomyces kononenkoae]